MKTRMTPDAVAAHLGVSVGTIRRWIQIGELPAVRIGPRKLYIDPDAVERVLQPAGPAGPDG